MENQLKTPFLASKPYIVSFLSDYGFKVTFGDRDDTLFARKAMELIIADDRPILSLNFLRNEFAGLSVTARSGIFDVICEDEHKRVFIIEMQVDNYENLLERLQLYAFQVFTSLPKKGKLGFENIGIVHCICIIKDSVTDSTNFHQVIRLKNEDNEIVMDNIVFHLIELAKFPIAKKDISKILTEKEELLYTMKYAHKFDPSKDALPSFWKKEYLQRPLKRLDISTMSPLDMAIYKNMLIRIDAAETIQEKKFNQALDKAVGEAVEKAVGEAEQAKQATEQAKQATEQAKQATEQAKQATEQAKQAAQQAKLDSIKKLLLRNKATVEEIAEDFEVSVAFVEEARASLNAPQA